MCSASAYCLARCQYGLICVGVLVRIGALRDAVWPSEADLVETVHFPIVERRVVCEVFVVQVLGDDERDF